MQNLLWNILHRIGMNKNLDEEKNEALLHHNEHKTLFSCWLISFSAKLMCYAWENFYTTNKKLILGSVLICFHKIHVFTDTHTSVQLYQKLNSHLVSSCFYLLNVPSECWLRRLNSKPVKPRSTRKCQGVHVFVFPLWDDSPYHAVSRPRSVGLSTTNHKPEHQSNSNNWKNPSARPLQHENKAGVSAAGYRVSVLWKWMRCKVSRRRVL